MSRTPRTIELSSISVRVPLEVRSWLKQRMTETGRQSLNEVVNDLIEDGDLVPPAKADDRCLGP